LTTKIELGSLASPQFSIPFFHFGSGWLELDSIGLSRTSGFVLDYAGQAAGYFEGISGMFENQCDQISLLFKNALPEWDLRYVSNLMAFILVGKAQYIVISALLSN
jgi:hypothetical protein